MPIHDDDAPGDPPPAAPPPRAAAPRWPADPDSPMPLQGVRILLVDDSPDALESFAMLLQLSGAEVACAHGGAQALAQMEAGLPDVLISDLGMPGMDGYELARALRRRPGGDAPVALALSGFGQQQDEARARAAGFDALIRKPALLEHIEDTVQTRLRRRRDG